MQEETDFLQRMQSAYTAQHADAKRMLNSLLFEYKTTLVQFPALQGEIQSVIDSVADLDIAAIVERLRPALQTASRLAVEIDTLDDAVCHHADMDKLIAQAKARLTLTSASVYAEKIQALAEKLAHVEPPPAAAPSAPSAPPAPALTGDALTFAQAEDLYFGDNGQKQDWVQAAVLYHRLAEKKHPQALARLADMYELGEGVKADSKKSQNLWRQAAEAGDGRAMAQIAENYRTGTDEFAQSYEQALFWASRARDAGARLACWALGLLYADEEFPDHDPVIALEHFQQGSEAGCAWSSLMLGGIYH